MMQLLLGACIPKKESRDIAALVTIAKGGGNKRVHQQVREMLKQ